MDSTYSIEYQCILSSRYQIITMRYQYLPLRSCFIQQWTENTFSINGLVTLNVDHNESANTVHSLNSQRGCTIVLGTLFVNNKKTRILCNWTENSSAYDCLSWRITHFGMILNSAVSISTIMSKGKGKDYEISPQ